MAFGGMGRGFGRYGAPLGGAEWLAPGSIGALDFANNRFFAAPYSFARGSSGQADDLSGNWSNFLSNVARITNEGLRYEPARTNSIASNLAGAVAGSPGTIPAGWTWSAISGETRTLALPGSLFGLPTLRTTHAGTTASGGQALNDQWVDTTTAVASPGQSWTASCYWQAIVDDPTFFGTYPPQLAITFRNSGGSNLGVFSTTITNRTTRQLVSLTATAPASTVYVLARIQTSTFGSGVSYNFTYDQSGMQIEMGATRTSPITGGAATARLADLLTLLRTGVGRVVFTLDDGSQQTISGISTAAQYAFPTTLNSNVIARADLYAS